MSKIADTENRVIFLDNLRYFFVICVVILHSANSYSNVLSWWPVVDHDKSIISAVMSAYIDASAILILFFIAGFFAVPTMERHGIGSFVKNKMKRLGLPWIICILIVCPILPLIYHYTRDDLILSMSYWNRWLLLMNHALDFNVGPITSMDALKQDDGFFQRYMWFISLLLLFFVVFSTVYKFKRGWFTVRRDIDPAKPKSGMSALALIFGFGSLTFALSVILINIISYLYPENHSAPEAWFTLGNIIQFQPSRLPAYAAYFVLGIFMYRNDWAVRGKFSGSLMVWVIPFVLFSIGYGVSGYLFMLPTAGAKETIGLILFFSRNLLSVTILGLMLTFGYRYWNSPSRISMDLAANSYNIYLSHYIFVVLFQLTLFSSAGVSGDLKFTIVATLALLCSYFASRFLIEPFPRTTVAAMLIMAAGMFFFIKP